MKSRRLQGSVVATGLVLALLAGPSLAQQPDSTSLGTGLSQEGQLKCSDLAYSGRRAFRFGLCEACPGGT